LYFRNSLHDLVEFNGEQGQPLIQIIMELQRNSPSLFFLG
jgi:hypothetical protein